MTIDRSYANSGCNTSKCYSCNFRFVCASSPYCAIQNNSNSTQITKDVQDFKKEVANVVNSQMNIITSIVEKLNTMNIGVSSIEESISELKKSIEDISSKIEIQEQPQEVLNPNEPVESQIVPFQQKEEKVIVEKRGLFGKTKWVEEKR